MRHLLAVSIVLAAGGLGSSALAQDFYGEREDGWFWYELPPAPPVELEVEEPPIEAVPPAPAVAAEPAPAAGPAFLSVAWIREHLDEYRDRAIDDPSPDNVRAFLLLQRVMMDKSSDFAAATQMVTMGDPLLDATAERPLATFGVHAQDRAAFEARQAALKQLAGRAGLMFFFRSDCPHCHAMAPVVDALAKRLGFTVVAVSIDGRGLQNGLFPEFRRDGGQSRVLGIQTVPALFLAMPPDQIVAVGQGSMAQESAERRLLMVARQQGWISEAAYDATLGLQRRTRVPEVSDIEAADLEDPAALTRFLRDNMTRGTVP